MQCFANLPAKSPPSFGQRALGRERVEEGAAASAPQAEEAVRNDSCSREATDDEEDRLGEAAVVASGATPVLRPDQVDRNRGFAYVGSLFHEGNIAQRRKAYVRPGLLVLSLRRQAKKYPPERVPTSFELRSFSPVCCRCCDA